MEGGGGRRPLPGHRRDGKRVRQLEEWEVLTRGGHEGLGIRGVEIITNTEMHHRVATTAPTKKQPQGFSPPNSNL